MAVEIAVGVAIGVASTIFQGARAMNAPEDADVGPSLGDALKNIAIGAIGGAVGAGFAPAAEGGLAASETAAFTADAAAMSAAEGAGLGAGGAEIVAPVLPETVSGGWGSADYLAGQSAAGVTPALETPILPTYDAPPVSSYDIWNNSPVPGELPSVNLPSGQSAAGVTPALETPILPTYDAPPAPSIVPTWLSKGAEKILPTLASNVVGSVMQSNMLKGISDAQSKSYADWSASQAAAYGDYMGTLAPAGEDYEASRVKAYQEYLNALNLPEEVKQARMAEAQKNINTSAAEAQRKLESTMAAKGVKGRGTAAPVSALNKSVMGATTDAYNKIYGTYNVPSQPYTPSTPPALTALATPPALRQTTPPPVNYSPSWMNLAGQNAAQLGTLWAMKDMFK